VASTLSHPHIVPTFAHSVKDVPGALIHRQIWLVQEFCSRGSLLDALEKGQLKGEDGRPNVNAILVTAKEVASAMRYAHARGLAHPCLTAANVSLSPGLLTSDGRGWTAKVTSTLWEPLPDNGSAASEERRSADVLAFGVMLWEMYAARRAYLGSEECYQVGIGVHLEVPRDAPGAVRSLMQRCLTPGDKGRPRFQVVVAELEAMLKGCKLTKPLSRVME
jgi:serine/threonine protein kinase